jgi:hypothetical protein
LKLAVHDRADLGAGVAPRAGARIETYAAAFVDAADEGRPPRGGANRNTESG